MKTFRKIRHAVLGTICLLSIFASCTSEPFLPELNTFNNQKIRLPHIDSVTIMVGFGNDNVTKITHELDIEGGQRVLKSLWEDGDSFTVQTYDTQNNESSACEMTLTGGAGTSIGTFSGPRQVDKNNYFIFYPGSLKTYSSYATFSYIGQTQKGNDNTDHLGEYDTMYAQVGDYTDFSFSNTGTYKFQRSSCLRIQIKELPEAIIPEKITLTINNADGLTFWTANIKSINSPSLSLSFQKMSSTDSFIGWMMRGPEEVVIPEGAILKMSVTGKTTDNEDITYTHDRSVTSKMTMPAGQVYNLNFKGGWARYEEYESSDENIAAYDKTECFYIPAEIKGDNPIDIVFLGDGYTDQDLNLYEQDMTWMKDNLFTLEPFKSHEKYFNLYSIYAVSKTRKLYEPLMNGAIDNGGNTVFSSTLTPNKTYISGSLETALSYAEAAINHYEGEGAYTNARANNVLVVIMVNADCHAGTCWSSRPTVFGTDYGVGFAVGFFSRNNDLDMRHATFLHEAVGHGFGKLADEYGGTDNYIKGDFYNLPYVYHPLGHRMNVDAINFCTTTNLDDLVPNEHVIWEEIDNDNETYPEVGKYEGANVYDYFFWRPTENSMMRDNVSGVATCFNAPSRRAIWYRIHKLYDSSFKNDYAAFKAWDLDNPDDDSVRNWQDPYSTTKASHSLVEVRPGHTPPVIIAGEWRDGHIIVE